METAPAAAVIGMPFHTPQYPWLAIDHKRGRLTCTRCKRSRRFNRCGGLEVLIDRLRPFAHEHKDCQEGAAKDAPTPRKEGRANA